MSDLQKFTKCDIFTPDIISKIMISKLKHNGNILEPSVGTGALLKNINLDNYDAVDVYELKKEYLNNIQDHQKIKKFNTDFLKKHIDTTMYDNIIMNPPYIKTQDLSVDYRHFLKMNFEVLNKGLNDIYYAFILKCLKLLKDDGVLVSITPNTFLYNKSALNLRKYLFENRFVEEIIDFKDKKVFNDASVYCCITVFSKKQKEAVSYNGTLIQYSNILKNYSLFNFNDKNTKTLSSICKITNGICTLKDSVFIHLKKLYDEPCWFPITNGSKIKYIIYPYKDGKIIDENIFKIENPLTYKYLLENKEELAKRDKGKKTYVAWYAYGRTQALIKSNKNCLYIPAFINPSNLKNNIFVRKDIFHQGCLCIEPNDENDIEKIKNILIENIDFIQQNSTKRSGGWISLSSRVLKIIKII
ncbi:putative N6 adenine-specific DNA methyltransferase [Aureococcus anophagefferens virus]|uniref:site-specific DNA-methyltransferase (adenine-specific) n=1 Tax=Aureococcus anophagefferens virus TaxID=1474867 RepID=A0A076FHE5_9VIRU|nr:putative N6 adenine-specific DNA methyltransferase [Aureococcus anophagefferens virus]AII17192.1 putative N6 adenine-specific DNA methyltransferase [Aureococcus anophagefferens virus]UOG94209.1 DNA modification [Aureococcus anophagefferens virus]